MAEARLYVGMRTTTGLTVQVIEGGRARALDERFDLANHSPTGFECGYGGSGPAQLALAILADHLGAERGQMPPGEEGTARARTMREYQAFKWELVACLPSDRSWERTSEDVEAALKAVEEFD